MVSTNLTEFHTVIVIVFSNDVVQNKRKKKSLLLGNVVFLNVQFFTFSILVSDRFFVTEQRSRKKNMTSKFRIKPVSSDC